LACVAVAGCGTDVTGARREGPAPSTTAKSRPPGAAVPAIASDPVALAGMVRRDTSVSADIREDLAPCGEHRSDTDYPLDADFGDLTSGDGPDLVVNVTTCGDGLGIGAYVYRMTGGKYRCVFADERPPVYGSVTDGRLEIVHEVYRTDDAVAYTAGEDAATYVWRDGHFVQVARSYSDFAAKDPRPSPEPTSTAPAPLPKSVALDPELPGTATPSPTATASGPAPTRTPAPSTAARPSPAATQGR
jgi:hypothetical protein